MCIHMEKREASFAKAKGKKLVHSSIEFSCFCFSYFGCTYLFMYISVRVHIRESVCLCVRAHMHVRDKERVSIGQKATSVSVSITLHIVWKQCLSLKMELTISAGLAAQRDSVSAICSSASCALGFQKFAPTFNVTRWKETKCRPSFEQQAMIHFLAPYFSHFLWSWIYFPSLWLSHIHLLYLVHFFCAEQT